MSEFLEFTNSHPEWQKNFEVYQRDDAVYQRILCRWNESGFQCHEYHACINTKTGDIYLDCRRRKIWIKQLFSTLIRPIHTCVKTIWHTSLIGPLAYEVIALLRGKQTAEDLAKNTFKSIIDIVKTPFYGLAITIVSLAALIFSIVSPNTLYLMREVAGRIERALLWGDLKSRWRLSQCFSPIGNIAATAHKFEVDSVKDALSALAAKQINFRRKKSNLFNNCGFLLAKNKAYISAVKADVRR